MDEVIHNADANAFFLPAAQAVVTNKERPKKAPLLTIERRIGARTPFAPWGDDNLFPQNVIEECRKSTVIPSTLDKMARMLYSGGIVWGKIDWRDEWKFKPIEDDAQNVVIRDYLRRIHITDYLMKASKQFYWFANVFPEIILNADRSAIVNIDVQPAWECRWGWQNERTGKVEETWINANWKTDPRGSFATKLPVIDPTFDAAGQLMNGKRFNYIYPISYPSVGTKFYQLADWDGARTGGWLDFSLSIADFKKNLMKNQMTIKWHIQIAQEWWEWKFPNWNKLNDKERFDKQKAELEKFNEFMKGDENAGNALLTTFRFDERLQKEFAGWKISPLENNLKGGEYIDDSQEASSHLLYALGVDPTLVGNGPGKKMGSGSGSDKRVAFNMYISSIRPHQDLILKPLELVRDYNGWDPDIEFRFRNSLITTLDSGKEMKEVDNDAV